MPVALGVNGGILGSNNLPSSGSAKGIWTPNEIARAVGLGFWPLVYARTVTETSSGADSVSINPPDQYFAYTTLLLPGNGTNGAQNNTFLDGSTNNFTITRNGNTTQGTFSPFSQTGWGNYFDGTGDGLTIPDNAAFNLSNEAFTIEAFIYPTTTKNYGIVVGQWAGVAASGSSAWVLRQDNTQKFQFAYTTNGTTEILITSSDTFSLNTWNHVVAVRDSSNNTALFVNGVRKASSTTTYTIFNSTYVCSIGAAQNFTDNTQGYISNVRVVKGTAIYDPTQTTLNVPTAPLTAVTNTQLLTCQSNRFVDNSTNNFTITRNGDTSVVPFSPFNPTSAWSASTVGGSGYFDGTGDFLSISSSPLLTMGTSDFTFECWTYITGSIASNYALFSTEVNDGILLRVTGGTLGFFAGNGSGWAVSGTGGTLTAFQWYHIALTRNGSNWTLWLNGQSQSVTPGTGNITGTAGIRIGRYRSGDDHYMNGYITNSRIIKGTALYTTNFSPPTAPLTAITNTSLLLNFTNSGIYDATEECAGDGW